MSGPYLSQCPVSSVQCPVHCGVGAAPSCDPSWRFTLQYTVQWCTVYTCTVLAPQLEVYTTIHCTALHWLEVYSEQRSILWPQLHNTVHKSVQCSPLWPQLHNTALLQCSTATWGTPHQRAAAAMALLGTVQSYSCTIALYSCTLALYSCTIALYSCTTALYSCTMALFSCTLQLYSGPGSVRYNTTVHPYYTAVLHYTPVHLCTAALHCTAELYCTTVQYCMIV